MMKGEEEKKKKKKDEMKFSWKRYNLLMKVRRCNLIRSIKIILIYWSLNKILSTLIMTALFIFFDLLLHISFIYHYKSFVIC